MARPLCYMPILHEGGGSLQAIAKLVAHFQGGNNSVPTNKYSRCPCRINKTGKWLSNSETLIKTNTRHGFAYQCESDFQWRCHVLLRNPQY